MSNTTSAAIELASFGLAVFPVRAGRKEPALRDWQARATTDPVEVARLFTGQDCNIGVLTGVRSGGFVLDIDRKGVDGLSTVSELEGRHGDLPGTWSVQTPSGGRHLWFASTTDRCVRNRAGFAPGLDIRGDGGFVVAPPSVVGDGCYRWLVPPSRQGPPEAPQWLLDLAAPQPPPPSQTRYTGLAVAGNGGLARYVAAAVVGEAQKVETAPPGRRNQTLFQAAANLGELVGAGVLRSEIAETALSLAAEVCGLTLDDGRQAVTSTIASGMRRGMANPREVTP